MAGPGASIVRVESLAKRFIVNKDKSLRSRLIGLRTGQRHREDFWALRDITLDVKAGSTVGLVGHNGSGKSTLLKSIGGILEPTSGTVLRRGRLAALLELGAGFHTDLTGRENVYLNAAILGLSRKETSRHFDEMVEFSGVEDFIDTQVKFYSSGMYVRLAFSVAVHVDPDLLLVDEVLAVGDEPYQKKCLAKIAEFQREGRSIILVSHSPEQVTRLCDRVAVLDSGRMIYDGAPADAFAVLRKRYSENVQSGQPASASTGRDRPARVHLVRSEVVDRAGMPHLTLVTEVEVDDSRATWGLEVSIETSTGVRVFTLETAAMNVALPTTPGLHVVTLEFPRVSLGSGTYVVDVTLTDRSGTPLDHRAGASTFDITSSGPGTGLLHLDPQVTVDSRL